MATFTPINASSPSTNTTNSSSPTPPSKIARRTSTKDIPAAFALTNAETAPQEPIPQLAAPALSMGAPAMGRKDHPEAVTRWVQGRMAGKRRILETGGGRGEHGHGERRLQGWGGRRPKGSP